MLKELFEKPEVVSDDIAIIGMAGKYPASNTLEKYWHNLKNGINCISYIPEKRREDCNILYSMFVSRQGKIVFPPVNAFRVGGYLDEIDKFDPAFFQIPPNEAKAMDPFQRLFLETAYNAIEEAGYSIVNQMKHKLYLLAEIMFITILSNVYQKNHPMIN